MKTINVALLTLALTGQIWRVNAHEHLAAGATSSAPGASLVFQNASDYDTESGYVFNLAAGAPESAYFGYYYTADLVLAALAATPAYGGPTPGAAAAGTYIQVKLLAVEGPAGSSFGFWETSADGVDSTNLTWSVQVPYHGDTRLISVTESDGSVGSDPYGHLHGRIFSVTQPGLYKATWQFVDTSTNGPAAGPVDLPSAPFSLYYQADLTIGAIAVDTNGVNISFAAPSNIPDSGVGPATNYQLEGSDAPGAGANWQPVGDTIVGDDHLHTIVIPANGPARFFRLRSNQTAR